MTAPSRIKLTASTDARNGTMWQRFRLAPNAFRAHVALIEWQDGMPAKEGENFRAWSEGPGGFENRILRGVPGYKENIINRFKEGWM